jgi:nitrate reductase NapE component
MENVKLQYDITHLVEDFEAMSAIQDPNPIKLQYNAMADDNVGYKSPIKMIYPDADNFSYTGKSAYKDIKEVYDYMKDHIQEAGQNDEIWDNAVKPLIEKAKMYDPEYKITKPQGDELRQFIQKEYERLGLLISYREKAESYNKQIGHFETMFSGYYTYITSDVGLRAMAKMSPDDKQRYKNALGIIISHVPEGNIKTKANDLNTTYLSLLNIKDKPAIEDDDESAVIRPLVQKKEEKSSLLWWVIGIFLVLAVVFLIVFVSVGFIIWFVIGYVLYTKRKQRTNEPLALVKALAYGPFYR